MGSTSDKVSGTGNQVAGKVKQAVGDLTDDSSLKSEGRLQEAKGDIQKGIGKAKDAAKDAVDKL